VPPYTYKTLKKGPGPDTNHFVILRRRFVEPKYCTRFVVSSEAYHYSDLLISGLNSYSDLSYICSLYNIYILYFMLAGMLLLFSMLGSILLCLAKFK